ncbi:MAG: beta-N-acetylglucosaminidase [Fluviicola sp. XM-24bin1]|nr:MAG: beta-N-acetylglucosaminidase [Fluviicola sp. XM-24bin1]
MKSKISTLILLGIATSLTFILWASLAETNTPVKHVSHIEPTPELEESIIPKEVPYTDNVSNAWVDETLSKLSLREKIAQFFMVAVYPKQNEVHFQHIDSLVSKHGIGGIIVFQGDRDQAKKAIKRYQGKASIPLLTAMDAEWGPSMRLSNEPRFPYAITIGAANDPALSQHIGALMGQECRDLGVHLNFAPVADVNSNPKNPVIGYRSFGENPRNVGKHVAATVIGMEGQSVLTSIKHFPGHGDTDTDSHKELPLVNNSYLQIRAIDFVPFQDGIDAGASTVMIAHLNVPALDSTGTPSSLSKPIIHGYLKGELGYNGLIVSDALGMKGVSNKYGKTEVVVKAFEAGCDILLMPGSVVKAIDAIKAKVNAGEISEEEINIRCKRVLAAKHKSIVAPKPMKEYTESERDLYRKLIFEKAITVLKNDNDVLPINRFDKKIAVVTVGKFTGSVRPAMDKVTKVDHFSYKTGSEALSKFGPKIGQYDMVISTLHAGSMRPSGNYKLPTGWKSWLTKLGTAKESALALFGSPLALKDVKEIDAIDAVAIGYENNSLMQDRMGQFLMGTFGSSGKLPVTVDSRFKVGHGLEVKWGGRLKDSQPEELGINPEKLKQIDSIAMLGVRNGAYPGCQVAVAIEGKLIYEKSYGHHTYSKKQEVQNTDVYDIASITKIAASTLSIMHLNSEDKFNLAGTLGDYIPEITGDSPFNNIVLRQMLSHQAGLTPWIPFYTKTLEEDKSLSPKFYAKAPSDSFNVKVSDNLWIRGDYEDVMYQTMLNSTLGPKRYKYSDVGYYFIKKIVEKQSGQSLDQFVLSEFYAPMGLQYMRYNPLEHFEKSQITPTENDKIFRKQQIHGYVHDQGAAMVGGVGGHAGLFSNAGDLASLMQLFLNNGYYGQNYIKEQVLKEYTDCQFCSTNRRGAGFDKPVREGKGGPSSNKVSLKSFGHTGFTGTIAWADPENQVNYVFLSNRVYQDAENWKLVRMDIRTKIQDVIYEALVEAKLK